MRYTTLIDISEMRAIYQNMSARILYLHLVLKAGYHDHDRDVVDLSIRQLSAQSGLTVSAVRHALKVLERASLVQRQGRALVVVKWLPELTIQGRQKKATGRVLRTSQRQEDAQLEMQEREAKAEEQKRQNEALRRQGKTNFMVYYEGLLERAQRGDQEAAEAVKRHRAQYEAHCQAIKNQE